MSDKLFATEKNNPASLRSHVMASHEILTAINDADMKVAQAVQAAIPALTQLVDHVVARIKTGGALYYIGAGTSGRLGVLDASECPPTFNTDVSVVQGIMAGGTKALHTSVEGAEDDAALGVSDTQHITDKDVLVGISASGSAEYVRAAIRDAKLRGAMTAAMCTAPDAPLLGDAEIAALADTGVEFVAGSTRMKSGTAQKMMLNMLSTAVMIRLGKVYAGRMIDVRCSNLKLQQRAVQMIATLTGCDVAYAAEIVDAIKEHTIAPVKTAVVMVLEGLNYEDACALLAAEDGRIDTIMAKHGRDAALGV